MLTLSQLLGQLSYGPLSNLSLSGEGDGVVDAARLPALVDAINDGLLALYGRFTLKEQCALIELQDHITQYHLRPEFAHTNKESTQPYRYILDSDQEPFLNDVLRITAVHDHTGRHLVLNNPEIPLSLRTPQHKTLYVPSPTYGTVLAVTYQARHVPLTIDDSDSQYVELPDVLVPALRHHVCSTLLDAMGTQESMGRGQNHMMAYENQCQEIQAVDLLSTSQAGESDHFSRGGWA